MKSLSSGSFLIATISSISSPPPPSPKLNSRGFIACRKMELAMPICRKPWTGHAATAAVIAARLNQAGACAEPNTVRSVWRTP
ncbi:hypothetical protein V6N13_038319 [Hibiscus sabdariffa]